MYKPYILLSFNQQLIAFASLYYRILEANILRNTLMKLKERIIDGSSAVCSELRKIISFVNKSDIYTSHRLTECLLFEPMFGNTIRIDQFASYSTILQPIQTNMTVRNSKTKLPSCAIIPTPINGEKLSIIRQLHPKKIITNTQEPMSYEIPHVLMGKGKTSILTPLIILHILTDPLYSGIRNIFIVLPNHLIAQTVDLLVKYSQILENTTIYHYNFENDSSKLNKVNSLRKIFVTNDVNFKLLHLHIVETHNKTLSTMLLDHSLVIFDEFDSLYNPNISNFNKILKEDNIIGLIDTEITSIIVDTLDAILLEPSMGLMCAIRMIFMKMNIIVNIIHYWMHFLKIRNIVIQNYIIHLKDSS